MYRLEPGGEKRRALEDFGGKMLNGLSLSGKLQSLGWFRGSVQDGGGYYTFTGRTPRSAWEWNCVFSGCFIGDENETVTVYDAVFYKAGTVKRGSYCYDTPKAEHIFALGDIPARYYSEVFLPAGAGNRLQHGDRPYLAGEKLKAAPDGMFPSGAALHFCAGDGQYGFKPASFRFFFVLRLQIQMSEFPMYQTCGNDKRNKIRDRPGKEHSGDPEPQRKDQNQRNQGRTPAVSKTATGL